MKKTPSPYDLSSNDNPGNIITQVQLKRDNYEEWQGPYEPHCELDERGDLLKKNPQAR